MRHTRRSMAEQTEHNLRSSSHDYLFFTSTLNKDQDAHHACPLGLLFRHLFYWNKISLSKLRVNLQTAEKRRKRRNTHGEQVRMIGKSAKRYECISMQMLR